MSAFSNFPHTFSSKILRPQNLNTTFQRTYADTIPPQRPHNTHRPPRFLGLHVPPLPLHLHSLRHAIRRSRQLPHQLFPRRIPPILPSTPHNLLHLPSALHYLLPESLNSSTECVFCTGSETNVFLRSVSADYADRWMDLGISLVYVGVNGGCGAVLAC